MSIIKFLKEFLFSLHLQFFCDIIEIVSSESEKRKDFFMDKNNYSNESITMLKGADKVRKRPAVIFGSDGLDGCQHSIFEIISNSIDEARSGYGNKIIITRFNDGRRNV